MRMTRDGARKPMNGELDWVYPEELEIGTAHWWSPDGKQVAYLQLDISREPVFPQVDALSVRARIEPERYPMQATPTPTCAWESFPPTAVKHAGWTLVKRATISSRACAWLPDGQRGRGTIKPDSEPPRFMIASRNG